MRKAAFFLIVLMVVGLGFYTFYHPKGTFPPGVAKFSDDATPDTKGNAGKTPAENNANKSSNNKSDVVQSPDSADNQGSDALQAHDILGNSNRLTTKQWANMVKWRKNIVKFSMNNSDEVYINGFTNEKKVCLTFDDGPDSVITPKILDILQQYNVKGSFFFIGSQLDKNRAVVKKAFDNGNLVLSHTWSHSQLPLKSTRQINNELLLTEDKLAGIIGRKPAIVRPPYGEIDDKTASVFKKDGVKAVLWSIDTLDWSQKERDNIVSNAVDNIRPGDIILMHSNEDKAADVKALPIIITALQEKGYRFVGLDELLGIPAYK